MKNVTVLTQETNGERWIRYGRASFYSEDGSDNYLTSWSFVQTLWVVLWIAVAAAVAVVAAKTSVRHHWLLRKSSPDDDCEHYVAEDHVPTDDKYINMGDCVCVYDNTEEYC